jgi:CheY-like chemotaxis protein
MVVDDDPAHRQLMTDVLTPLGFAVISAESGPQCLELLAQAAVHLFLLDVAMPEMSGWQLLRHLRAEGCEQPILMISAEADKGNWQKIKTRGEIRFQTKPLRLPLLLDNIGSLLDIEWLNEADNSAPEPISAGANSLNEQEYQQLVGLARLGYAKGFRERLQQLVVQRKVNPLNAESLDRLASRFRFESVVAELATLEIQDARHG